MTKDKIIKQLQEDVYCRIGRSEISGIGVIAIKDIPNGTDPFKDSDLSAEYIGILPEELPRLDLNIERYMKDMCVFEDGKYWLPDTGLQTITIGWYLNHSKTPNMTATHRGENFIASRDIKAGEELTVDYSTYDESREDEDFG